MEQGNPKFQCGQIVKRKFHGTGTVDQVRPSSTGFQYHILFQSGIALWAIEQDLEPAKEPAPAGSQPGG